MEQTVENVVIIGSGPAGHTAAIYTARAELRPLLVEGFSMGGSPGGQLMTTTEVENFPGFPQGITGPALMDAMRAQGERFGVRFLTKDVERVDLSQRPFRLEVEGKTIVTHSLIIATGASARYIGLPSEQRLMNRGVSACATCDGALPLFRNKPLAVIGGGDSAMEEALFLTRFASVVYLIHRREGFRASKIMVERMQRHSKIVCMVPFEVAEVLGEEEVTGLRLRHVGNGSEQHLPVAGMFVAIGHTPNAALFAKQLRCDEQGYLVTASHSSKTSIEGVFACGDVQDHVFRQAITAAGSGCQAAIEAERWLQAEGLAG